MEIFCTNWNGEGNAKQEGEGEKYAGIIKI